MGKILLLVSMLAFSFAEVKSQDKFQVSGRIDGVQEGTLHIVTAETAETDTLASTRLKNGAFMFTGNQPVPVAVRLVMEGGKMNVPFILENAVFMLNVTGKGALIQGGQQQMLFGRYNRVAQEFAVEQMRVREELQQAGADVPSLQARMDEAYKVYTGRTMELVKANPDAYTTAFVVYLGLANETEESLRGKYDLLGENAKASVPGRQIAAALERYAALEVGKDAPNFTATRPNGDKFTLRELPGKMKLLVFWASADAASRQANPGFIKLYRQFRPKGFEIVSISLDENRFEWERAIEQDGLIWTNGCDFCGRNAGIASLYMVGNASLPYTILIDDENKIVVKGLAGKDLEESIRQLSKKKTNR